MLFQGEKCIHRWHMQKSLAERSEITDEFFFTEKEFKQVQLNNKEIQVEGKIYDMVSIERIEGKVQVRAIHDSEEEKINEKFSNLLNDQSASDSDKEIYNQIQKLITLSYLLPTSDIHLILLENRIQHYRDHRFSSSKYHFELNCPPPELLA
jgi:type II secretory ATPase GspE/PulE/Tfp pilus assembly ATPase PilB-like protein